MQLGHEPEEKRQIRPRSLRLLELDRDQRMLMVPAPDILQMRDVLYHPGWDTAALYGWLMQAFSFQGISDAAAIGYMDQHGRVKWADIEYSLPTLADCPIRRVASRVDARCTNPEYPRAFPRFVQHAIWRYCAQLELNICNGNTIDDGQRCRNSSCALFEICDRVRLTP